MGTYESPTLPPHSWADRQNAAPAEEDAPRRISAPLDRLAVATGPVAAPRYLPSRLDRRFLIGEHLPQLEEAHSVAVALAGGREPAWWCSRRTWQPS